MKEFIFKEQTMLMKYCKIFCIYSALLIVMLGIWVEGGTAQSDWMPDAEFTEGSAERLPYARTQYSIVNRYYLYKSEYRRTRDTDSL